MRLFELEKEIQKLVEKYEDQIEDFDETSPMLTMEVTLFEKPFVDVVYSRYYTFQNK